MGWAWPSSAPACSLTNLWFGVCQTYFIHVQANLIQTWVSGWAELDPAQPQLVHWLICGSEFWGNFISKNKMGSLSHKIIINIIDINIVLREGLKKRWNFPKVGGRGSKNKKKTTFPKTVHFYLECHNSARNVIKFFGPPTNSAVALHWSLCKLAYI